MILGRRRLSDDESAARNERETSINMISEFGGLRDTDTGMAGILIPLFGSVGSPGKDPFFQRAAHHQLVIPDAPYRWSASHDQPKNIRCMAQEWVKFHICPYFHISMRLSQ